MSAPESAGSGPPTSRSAPAELAFWRDAVLSEPDLGFAVLDGSGRLLFANQAFGDVLLGSPATVMIGLTLDELLAPGIAQERMEFVDRVTRAGRSLIVVEVWRGVRCRSVWRLLPGGTPEREEVLWTVRRTPVVWPEAEPNARADALDAQHVDWGPLAGLSSMERRILGLIASGLTQEQIAGTIGLALDEVELARLNIERVLRTPSLVHLVRRAFLAGLVEP